MKICSVICGAPDGWLPEAPEGLIICADSGLDTALSYGIIPDIMAGDFDSVSGRVPDGAEIYRAAPEKDFTDTMLACDIAIERGCGEIRLYCALGGRFDHAAANIQTLEYLRLKGVRGVIIGRNERVYLLHEDTVSIPRFDGYVSVFAFGGDCVVSETGMKYGLSHHRLSCGFPLGVSNEITGAEGVITVHQGTALLTEYRVK